jgi:hypothetical protein
MREGWQPECNDFLRHGWFRETQLNEEQRTLSERIMRQGTLLEKHVLDWCLKMLIPCRALQSGKHPDWLVLSYERIVLEPEAVVRELSTRLDLPDVNAMLAQVRRPSRTVTGATAGRVDEPKYLLDRWRGHVKDDEQRKLLSIVEAFGIDLTPMNARQPRDS